jgi:hypothetical protein
MSGWNSKPSYPPHAVLRIPVRATDGQKWAWSAQAKKQGMASPGAFLAWAADLYIALHQAWEDAVEEHQNALKGYAGMDGGRLERELRRQKENDK